MYYRFGEACCLRDDGACTKLHGMTSHKAAIFILVLLQ